MSNRRNLTVIVPTNDGKTRDVTVEVDVRLPSPGWLCPKLVASRDPKPSTIYLILGGDTHGYFTLMRPIQIIVPDRRIQLGGQSNLYHTAPALEPVIA